MDKKTTLSIIIPNHKERRLMEVYARIKWYFPHAEIILSDDLEGRGKGWAVREGYLKSKGNVIIFLDGDMDVEPKEIKKLLAKLDRFDVIIGTKDLRNLPFKRKILTFCSRKFIRWWFDLPISDTQTGLKVFKREAIFDWKTDGFAYDCELLLNAYEGGFKICEVPIKVKITDSKSIKDILKTFMETIKIRKI